MSGIPKEAAVKTGQAVVTGGFGVKGLRSPYPPGIPVGAVTSVGTREVDVDRTVQVTPYVDPRARSRTSRCWFRAAPRRSPGRRVSSGLQTRAVGPAAPRPLPRAGSARFGWVTAIALGAVLLQVTVMPYINVGDGIPDLIAPTVVVIAILRGTLVGAVTGFAMGLLVELASPVGTLGVLALLYLVIGAWCGRFCSREESSTLTAPLVLSVAAALVVQIGVMIFQLLLGTQMPVSSSSSRCSCRRSP